MATLQDIITNNTPNAYVLPTPTGGTANKVAVSPSGGVNTFSSVTLQSGVHFRSDLNNTGTIFIGFSSAVSSQVGFPLYNDSIEPFLSAGKGSRGKNKVLECDRAKLLKYCGLDSMLEFRLAVRQIQLMGFDYPWRTK
jgi:hypothetical protein